MTLQRGSHNPIEEQKQSVRRYFRNASMYVAGGVIGGVLLALLFSSWFLLAVGLVVAVVGGGYSVIQIRKIVSPES